MGLYCYFMVGSGEKQHGLLVGVTAGTWPGQEKVSVLFLEVSSVLWLSYVLSV